MALKSLRILIWILLCLQTWTANARVEVMLESGADWQSRNDVRFPNPRGSLVALDELETDPFLHQRIEARYRFTDSHSVRLLWAPFEINVNGLQNEDILFDGATINGGQAFNSKYKFNSYRISYIYSFLGNKDRQFNLGFTGKVRDAEIAFSQGSTEASFSNVGFVPLVYIEYQTPIFAKWLFNINMDGAAAPQGRAFDVAIKLRRQINSFLQLGIGLRTLEGGADNDEVFTFSWFNYGVVDLTGRF